jgi:hypothetical protein
MNKTVFYHRSHTWKSNTKVLYKGVGENICFFGVDSKRWIESFGNKNIFNKPNYTKISKLKAKLMFPEAFIN